MADKNPVVVVVPSQVPEPRRSYNPMRSMLDAWAGWFNPGTQIAPMAPPESGPRAWDYPSGYNTQLSGRNDALFSAQDLRNLSRSCDLLRLAMETRKDQMAQLTWEVKARAEQTSPTGKAQKVANPKIEAVTAFFRYPDKQNPWRTWLRLILEDVFCLDTPSIFRRPARDGSLYALEVLDGATIRPLLDLTGRPPLVGPAYQQIIKGMPAYEFTRDQLFVVPRNPVPDRITGLSPVEQIALTVTTAIRRALGQLEYYVEGNVPNTIFKLPPEWSPTQIEQFAVRWNEQMQGRSKREARFVPGGPGMDVYETREPPLKDEFDEWLARVISYAFSLPPTPFVKMMNRATSESLKDAALEEGLLPLMGYVKDFADLIITVCFDAPELEFAWQDMRPPDPQVQSLILTAYVDRGIMSIDEAREELGMEAIGAPNMILMGGVMIPVGDAAEAKFADKQAADDERQAALDAKYGIRQPLGFNDANADPNKVPPKQIEGPPRAAGGEEGQPPGKATKDKGANDDDEDPGQKPPLGKALRIASLGAAQKRRMAIGAPGSGRNSRAVKQAETRLGAAIFRALKLNIDDIAGAPVADMQKAPADSASGATDVLRTVELRGWDLVGADATRLLVQVARQGVREAGMKLAVGGEAAGDLFPDAANDRAVTWATARGAELVGKRVLGDGTVIDNPNPKWSISEATRDFARSTVIQAFDEGLSLRQIRDALSQNVGFTESRAMMVARTETAGALVQGNLATWRESGEVVGKQWVLGSEHEGDDDCNTNANAGEIGIDDTFPTGDDGPPAHPNCVCDVLPVLRPEDDTTDAPLD